MAKVSEKPKAKNLTMRQQNIVSRMVKNAKEGKSESAKELLLASGYSANSAENNPGKILKSQTLQEYLQEHLPKELQQKVLAEALNAKTVVAYRGDARETDAPDYATRLKALSLVGDFMGTKIVNVRQTSVNVNASTDELRQLLGFN